MSLKLVGKIIHILPPQDGVSKTTNKPWKMQSFVIETNEQYARKICFELFGDERVRLLENFHEDDTVTVSFDLDSREFNGRWYTSARAWSIVQGDQLGAQPTAQPTAQPASNMQAQPAAQPAPMANTGSFDSAAGGDNTDLPF